MAEVQAALPEADMKQPKWKLQNFHNEVLYIH